MAGTCLALVLGRAEIGHMADLRGGGLVLDEGLGPPAGALQGPRLSGLVLVLVLVPGRPSPWAGACVGSCGLKPGGCALWGSSTS